MEEFFVEEIEIHQELFDIKYSKLKGVFENCIFNGVSFEAINLSHFKFLECVFKNCNFSNCHFKSLVLRNAKFNDCKLVGINWTFLNNFGQFSYENCLLNYSAFQGMNLTKSHFINCQIEEVGFEEANLSKVNFINCNLSGSNFDHANLNNSVVDGCVNFHVDITRTNLKGANISAQTALELIAHLGITII